MFQNFCYPILIEVRILWHHIYGGAVFSFSLICNPTTYFVRREINQTYFTFKMVQSLETLAGYLNPGHSDSKNFFLFMCQVFKWFFIDFYLLNVSQIFLKLFKIYLIKCKMNKLMLRKGTLTSVLRINQAANPNHLLSRIPFLKRLPVFLPRFAGRAVLWAWSMSRNSVVSQNLQL